MINHVDKLNARIFESGIWRFWCKEKPFQIVTNQRNIKKNQNEIFFENENYYY